MQPAYSSYAKNHTTNKVTVVTSGLTDLFTTTVEEPTALLGSVVPFTVKRKTSGLGNTTLYLTSLNQQGYFTDSEGSTNLGHEISVVFNESSGDSKSVYVMCAGLGRITIVTSEKDYTDEPPLPYVTPKPTTTPSDPYVTPAPTSTPKPAVCGNTPSNCDIIIASEAPGTATGPRLLHVDGKRTMYMNETQSVGILGVGKGKILSVKFSISPPESGFADTYSFTFVPTSGSGFGWSYNPLELCIHDCPGIFDKSSKSYVNQVNYESISLATKTYNGAWQDKMFIAEPNRIYYLNMKMNSSVLESEKGSEFLMSLNGTLKASKDTPTPTNAPTTSTSAYLVPDANPNFASPGGIIRRDFGLIPISNAALGSSTIMDIYAGPNAILLKPGQILSIKFIVPPNTSANYFAFTTKEAVGGSDTEKEFSISSNEGDFTMSKTGPFYKFIPGLSDYGIGFDGCDTGRSVAIVKPGKTYYCNIRIPADVDLGENVNYSAFMVCITTGKNTCITSTTTGGTTTGAVTCGSTPPNTRIVDVGLLDNKAANDTLYWGVGTIEQMNIKYKFWTMSPGEILAVKFSLSRTEPPASIYSFIFSEGNPPQNFNKIMCFSKCPGVFGSNQIGVNNLVSPPTDIGKGYSSNGVFTQTNDIGGATGIALLTPSFKKSDWPLVDGIKMSSIPTGNTYYLNIKTIDSSSPNSFYLRYNKPPAKTGGTPTITCGAKPNNCNVITPYGSDGVLKPGLKFPTKSQYTILFTGEPTVVTKRWRIERNGITSIKFMLSSLEPEDLYYGFAFTEDASIFHPLELVLSHCPGSFDSQHFANPADSRCRFHQGTANGSSFSILTPSFKYTPATTATTPGYCKLTRIRTDIPYYLNMRFSAVNTRDDTDVTVCLIELNT